MSRKNTVKIISFCVAAVLVSVGFTVKAKLSLKRYKLQIQNNYSRSLDELNSGLNNISLILQKAEYSTTAKMQSQMAAELLSESESAKNSLSELPSGNELTVINRFLSQVGNYAITVSKSLIGGEKLTPKQEEGIEILKNTAKRISETVGNSSISYNNPAAWSKEIDRQLEDTVDKNSLAGSLGELETSLSDYPTLVYDGPYSDHILEKEPTMIKSAKTVGKTDALAVASKIAEVGKNKLSYTETVNGKIPAYRFVGENVSVTVSVSGGYATAMRKTRKMGDYILDYRQALEKAKRYLEKIGMSGFTETYYYTDEGGCVINFAYLDGSTICYTDLVKVGVAMDTGEIMLYEAGGYLANHTERAFETPAVSSGEAAKVINGRLKIRETALALIPTKSGEEKRCYEFVCETQDGQEILIYINVITLEEEDILILLKSDGGTLTK